MVELSKPELRSRFRRLRAAALPPVEAAIQAVASRELATWLMAPPGANSSRSQLLGATLGLYWPLAGEADLRSCLQQNFPSPPLPSSALPSPALPSPALSAPPWTLALPAIASTAEDHQLGLRYRPWQPGDPLEADDCGIAAPLACPPLPASAMAALLLPCLALDGRGLRLGYGGGSYDRTLAAFARRPRTIAVVYDFQVLVEVPHLATDIAVDWVLTDRRSFRAADAAASPFVA
jgi:5-formyltetrahydrofolate cyclo-ligase